MTQHIFGAIITGRGIAANNRGITEGNITTLQKIIWDGHAHTTVSAESIRFALRRHLENIEPCNRTYDEVARTNQWADGAFSRWIKEGQEAPFLDDDLLGFMSATGPTEEREKGTTKTRKSVLEVTRAVSLTPWQGDVTFNAASPGATPSAAKKDTKEVAHPTLYGTEMHATRYQYGIAMTPGRLCVISRASLALRGLCALGEVAGNHGRFLFDFSPESVVFRVTHDPAPRLLYVFEQDFEGKISISEVLRRVEGGDIKANELIIGGALSLSEEERAVLAGATLLKGVMAACEAVCQRIVGAP